MKNQFSSDDLEKINEEIEEKKEQPKEKKDIKKYMDEYRQKNPDKWYKSDICDLCNGKYKVCTKSTHMKSSKHKYGVLQKENEKLKDFEKKYYELEEKIRIYIDNELTKNK